MGKFEDYINSLEGKDNLDPVVIAQTLHELHTTEIATANAQIAELNENVQTFTSTIAEKDQEIQKQMAANWRLANQVPADARASQGNNDEPEAPVKTGFDQFFKED
jgi:ABC-type transporter Mla subunit MlaD